MLELRPYQKEAIHQLREAFKAGHERIVLCLPTGAGKTACFSEMVRLAHEKGTTTLVLTDRIELFKQTIRALSRVGIEAEEIRADKKHINHNARIYLGMIETVKRRMKSLSTLSPKLIIIDEAHIGNFTDIFHVFPNAKVIGATATPVGEHFYEYYTSIIQNIDVPELVESGFLVPCKAFQMVDDFKDLRIQRGEFSMASLNAHYNKPTLYKGVVEQWLQYAQNKKTVVFNVSIEHTQQINAAFLTAGISSEYVTSHTPKEERETILQAFSAGKFMVLNNCGILTKGWDEPSVECVVMNRATTSLTLWLQCIGRGSRPYPGKEYFTLLDFGGNHTRLGLWNEPRHWKLSKKKETLGVAPVKDCPACRHVCYSSASVCDECGHTFTKDKEEKEKGGVMVEVPSHIPKSLRGKKLGDLTIPELAMLHRSKKYKHGFVPGIVRSYGESALREFASLMGYKEGWVYAQIHTMKSFKFTNFTLR